MNAQEKEYTDEEIRDQLDDIYGTVEVCGYTHDSGALLKEIDPIAFRQAGLDLFDQNPRYECGKCGEVYDNEEEAEECCRPEGEE